MAIPKTIAGCVDRFYSNKIEAQRITKEIESTPLAKKLAKLQAEMKDIEEHLIETLPAEKLEGAMGKLAKCELKTSFVYSVKDRKAFNAYIATNDAFDLLNASPKVPACRERFEAGEVIPGLEQVRLKKLSVTKK